MLRDLGLRITASDIPGAGKGLFARKDFRRGDLIIPYDGERVTYAQLTHRYADYTAPYGLASTRALAEDGACHRGIGAMVNGASRRAGANAEFYRGKGNVLKLRARKNIRDGQEILAHYGPDYRFDEAVTYSTK